MMNPFGLFRNSQPAGSARKSKLLEDEAIKLRKSIDSLFVGNDYWIDDRRTAKLKANEGGMESIAENHPLGVVGTVNADGTPNVSPKGTMVIINDDTIIFGEIASPGTLANVRERPDMEINFVDTLARRCFRAKGKADALSPDSNEFIDLRPHFDRWGKLADRIRHIIRLRVSETSIVVTPAYAMGQSEAELKAHWKAHYASLD